MDKRFVTIPGNAAEAGKHRPFFSSKGGNVALFLVLALVLVTHSPHGADAIPSFDDTRAHQEQLVNALCDNAFLGQKCLRSVSFSGIGPAGNEQNGSSAFRGRVALDNFWQAHGIWDLLPPSRSFCANAILPVHGFLRIGQGEWTLLGKSFAGRRLYLSSRSFLFFRGDTERMQMRSV